MNYPIRKPLRLPHYDYSETGCYFITLCTQGRLLLFELENNPRTGDEIVAPDCAPQNQILHNWVRALPSYFPSVCVDLYVILPDHLHMLLSINRPGTNSALSDIMQCFKSGTTKDYIAGVKEGCLRPFDRKLWQKSYYDHVIRNHSDYLEIWQYIANNPKKWIIDHP
ncbi:MAG: transposase [Clostridiales bacterium]|nr:transposase [Clostridiales bacterium]